MPHPKEAQSAIERCRQLSRDGTILAFHLARQDTLHAEGVTQTRLTNFLFCVSVLFVAWATIFVNESPSLSDKRQAALVIFSTLSFLVSAGYAILGYRGDRFISMHYDISLWLESLLRDVPDTVRPIVSLQDGLAYVCQSEEFKGVEINIPPIARITAVSSHLLGTIPSAFALAAVGLFVLSVLG